MLTLEDVGEFGKGSSKFHWTIRDDESIGSTFYDMSNKDHPSTLCIATQLGCEVGCRFCHAHLRDGVSNLQPEEMFAQAKSSVQQLQNQSERDEIESLQIAFMGYGEPMHNLKNVIEAKELIKKRMSGLDISFNLSTSGWAPGIDALSQRDPTFRLYVSLHASDDDTRSQLIPNRNTFSLEEIVSSARTYYEASGEQVTANYLLIEGMNDSREDAERLAELLEPEVFTISLSHLVAPPVETLNSPEDERFEEFRDWLTDRGMETKVF
jgi:23S rRNA (adenine2503-C2)-methyltransferase